MRFWLITVGEPLPCDEGNARLLRTGLLAGVLAERGHEVVWWSSDFDHIKKKDRYGKDTILEIEENFKIILLHSFGYRKNVSISRIINHMGVACKFFRFAGSQPEPDIILCSMPTIELGYAAVMYGKKRRRPVILDIRDLWPDIFLDLAPSCSRPLLRLILWPMYRAVRASCSGAFAITGITRAFVEWGVNYADRPLTVLDRDFPLGYSRDEPTQREIADAEKLWTGLGLSRNEFNICFFGTFGRQFEIETVIEAAKEIKSKNLPYRFILCGSGDNLDYFRDMARDCDIIIFPGWVGAAEIWTLMRLSSAGLAPYRSSKDFMTSIPNKPIEYLSAGLPVVSSLKGQLEDLLSAYDCGVTYENGNSSDLASKLVSLYENPDKLKIMSENAMALYEERFVAEKVYSDMTGYMESVHANFINCRER